MDDRQFLLLLAVLAFISLEVSGIHRELRKAREDRKGARTDA